MTRPTSDIVQMEYQNPHAKAPLTIPVLVVCNTSDEDLKRNIRINAARPLDWVAFVEPHDGVAVLVGGGPSMKDNFWNIERLADGGGTVFAMNAAAGFLAEHDIVPDYQVIADAKPETASLVSRRARKHLFASQCDPACFEKVRHPTLWHLDCRDMEAEFPPERVKRGNYAIVGGGASVGNSALSLAYVLGFRNFHVFGYDSSHRGEASHAYDQPMNRFIPCVNVEWGGKVYKASVAMKAQAEKFQMMAQLLKQEGCTINVHGDGLLPAMYLTEPADLTERDKYRMMWRLDTYREVSPGEDAVAAFLDRVKPAGMVLDFGCGTGRASIAMHKAGLQPYLIDFADNCRDEEAVGLPFLEWDLTRPLPCRAPYGFCADVMEHIPTDSVDGVIRNIMGAAKVVFFQISTIPDRMGAFIGAPLHMTVRPAEWWADAFTRLGHSVEWQEADSRAARFVVHYSGALC